MLIPELVQALDFAIDFMREDERGAFGNGNLEMIFSLLRIRPGEEQKRCAAFSFPDTFNGRASV